MTTFLAPGKLRLGLCFYYNLLVVVTTNYYKFQFKSNLESNHYGTDCGCHQLSRVFSIKVQRKVRYALTTNIVEKARLIICNNFFKRPGS